MSTAVKKQKRERLTDAQLLMTISICIFLVMYGAAMIFMGERLNQGGSKKDWSALRNLPDGIIFGYSANVPD